MEAWSKTTFVSPLPRVGRVINITLPPAKSSFVKRSPLPSIHRAKGEATPMRKLNLPLLKKSGKPFTLMADR